MSHQKSGTFTEDGRVFVVNTAGYSSGRGALSATRSKKNRKNPKPKSFPNTEDGFIAAENESRRRSSETDDVRQKNSEGRKGAANFSRVPHHNKHLSKGDEKEARKKYRKRQKERAEKEKKEDKKS